MRCSSAWRILGGAICGVALFGGCNGGGDSPGQAPIMTGNGTVLAWTPPAAYNDNSPLDPVIDLDYYELYVREDKNFADDDLPVAEVAAVLTTLAPDGLSLVQTVVTEFNLELVPNVPNGNQVYVSLKAVGVDKQRSAFMTPVSWKRG